jgi:hypothetical protein
LALASKTSNANPYAIRGHFSHRKRDTIRRKRGFSGLFAVSGYRRGGFKAKIPQRNKALFEKIAMFEHPNAGRGDGLEAEKSCNGSIGSGFRRRRCSFRARPLAAPTLALTDLNIREAGDG